MVTLARPLMKNDLSQACQYTIPCNRSYCTIPFIGIRVPVHLAHSARLDVQMTGSDSLGNREVLAVHNTRFAAAALVGWGVEHVVGVLVLRLLERRRLLLINALRDRACKPCQLNVLRNQSSSVHTLENVLVLLVDVLENLRRQAEVLCYNSLGCVLNPLVQEESRILRKVAAVKD